MTLICRLDVVQSSFERAGVQSFWEAFKRIEGFGVVLFLFFLNKTEEHLAKLEELVICLLKGSVLILTLPLISLLIQVTPSFKCSVILNCSPLNLLCAYCYCRADVFH